MGSGRCHATDPGADSQSVDCGENKYWDPVLGVCIKPADPVNPARDRCIDKGWIWHQNSCHDPNAQKNCEAGGGTWTAGGCVATTSYNPNQLLTPSQIRKGGKRTQLATLQNKTHTETIAFIKKEKTKENQGPLKRLAIFLNLTKEENKTIREIVEQTNSTTAYAQDGVARCPDRTGKGVHWEGYSNGWGAITCEECDVGQHGSDDCYGPEAGWQYVSLWKPKQCGNGTIEAGEKCDDGDSTNAGTCNSSCSSATICGDYTVQTQNGQGLKEECDDGPQGSDDCTAECIRGGKDVLEWEEVVAD